MFGLGDVVDAVDESGADEPFDGFFKFSGAGAFFHGAVDKLFVWLCELGDEAAKDHEDATTIDAAVVL